MSERRRFFVATPVQTVPGGRVELAVQIKHDAPVAPPGPAIKPELTWMLPLPARVRAGSWIETEVSGDGHEPEYEYQWSGDDYLMVQMLRFAGQKIYPFNYGGDSEASWALPLPPPHPGWRNTHVLMQQFHIEYWRPLVALVMNAGDSEVHWSAQSSGPMEFASFGVMALCWPGEGAPNGEQTFTVSASVGSVSLGPITAETPREPD